MSFVNSPNALTQIKRGSGSSLVGYTAYGGAPMRTVEGRLRTAIAAYDFGVEADGVNDDIDAMREAIIYAKQQRDSMGVSSIDVVLPYGKIYCSEGVPLVKGVNLVSPSRWSSLISTDWNGAACYSATLDGETFSDNLDASVAEVTTGSKEVNNAGIFNVHFEHVGTMSGNAGSGAPWESVVQLVGTPDAEYNNVRVSSQSNNYGGLSLKFGWRSKICRFYATRGGAYSGGRALEIGSDSNEVECISPFVYGNWDYGIRAANPYGFTLISPRFEAINLANSVAIFLAGWSHRVLGGYLEGNAVDIQLGSQAATACSDFVIQGVNHNSGSGITDYFYDLDNANGGQILFPQFRGTVAQKEFKSNSKVYNKGIKITLKKSNASEPDLVGLGLDSGNNIVEVLSADYSDHRGLKKWSTDTVAEVEQELNQRGAKFCSFEIWVENVGGVLQCAITTGDGNDPVYNDCFIASSASLVSIQGVGSSVDFGAVPVGVLTVNDAILVLNTGNNVEAEQGIIVGSIRTNSGEALSAQLRLQSRNIGGNTITRPEITVKNQQSDAGFSLSSLAAGEFIKIPVQGFIK
ncbi:MAG: hypothetical protein ACRBBR_00645 [Cellvibrionaceae bacterium]